MSKPEHTNSPAALPEEVASPSAGQGGAVPGDAPAVSPAAGPAEAGSPSGDAAVAPAAEPEGESAAADGSAGDAEPDTGAPATEPEDAEPIHAAPAAAGGGKSAAKSSLSEGAAAADAGGSAVEPEDAKPADAGKATAKLSLGKGAPADAKSAEAAKSADKPGPGKGAAEGEGAKPAPGRAGGETVNPVVEKADAMAAAVKAAAAKAAADGGTEGRLLAGRYRLGAVLGKGGMGTVWRAQDETLGRTVAVKELRFSTGVDEDEKRRLITRTLREAKAIARIRSGGAVTVYDVVDEDGRPWIVMELIEGPSLAEFVRENGPLTPRRAAEVGLAVLDVLRAAHGQGILHRDVKPSNVLIAANGRVVLTDFGIAQVEGDPSVTSTGMLVGAPSYISPERARGQKPGPPADMWSLGGLLYASVEGVPPYDKGSALATLTAVMTEPVDPPKNAGPLADVIYGLLVKDPAGRLDDDGARAMLTAVVNAPEPVAPPVVAPNAEETRQISLADAKEAVDKAAAEKAEKAAEKAAKKERERRERDQRERARAALKSARKEAAAAAAAAAAVPTASAAEAPASGRPAPVAAPVTDVLPRRTIAMAVAAVLVVLAAVGSLIAYMAGGDDEGGGKPQGKNGGKPTPAASGNQTPGQGQDGTGKNTPQNASPDTSQSTPSSSASAGGGGDSGTTSTSQGQGAPLGGGVGGLPAGFATVTDPGFHFSMAMPQGFHQTGTAGQNSGAIYSRDGGFPRIQVDYNSSPGDDARKAWLELAPAVAGSSKGYKLIDIRVVNYRNYPTVADWEFERVHDGVKVHVVNRGFKMDEKHGYAIMISCAADQWDGAECTQMRNVAYETFQPLG
ncbi:serine/threonine-protein kinase [Streptomyces sp. NPDC002467]|uniref:serine/threonine-protein kinase n=1 Tax=Streptomyces sp. NPDC002467 TaxID=3364647 RepID=UPI00368FD5A3